MEIKAKLQDLRVSPRKTRLVVDVIRGLSIEDAFNQLNFVNKKVTLPIKNLLDSAVANALNNFSLEKNNLFIKEIRVDEGRTLKRWMPRARGRATPIRKRTSHITLVLGELVDSGEKKAKKQKIEAPVKLGANVKEEGKAKVKVKK
jgi:large subunit ribosomal protein L22